MDFDEMKIRISRRSAWAELFLSQLPARFGF